MKRLLVLLFLSLSLFASAQTHVSSLEIDTPYVSGIRNGIHQVWKASEFSGGDNLGNSIATQAVDMANNPLEGATYITLFDNNVDGDSLVIIEDGISGNYEIRKSSTAAPLIEISPAGQVTFGGTSYPTIGGANGYVIKSDGTGGSSWQPDNAGSGGSGTTIYHFDAKDTSTTSLTSGVWNPITWDILTIDDPYITHIGNDTLRLDTIGIYRITVTYIAQGPIRQDVWTQINWDQGLGLTSEARGKLPIIFNASAFDNQSTSMTVTVETTTINNLINAEMYPGASGFTFAGSTVAIDRLE